MASIVTGLGGSIGLGENSIWHGAGVDYGTTDDGAVQVDVTSVFGAGGINFFGTNYTSVYINTNGTITFDGPELSYTPAGVGGLNYPAVAPFFTDVNIGAFGHINGANDIYWDLDPVNDVFTVTWYEVLPYSGSGNNTFQVRFHDLGDGDFDVEFIYEDIEWTDGGYGVASVGMTDGGTNDFVLPGSQNSSQLSNYPTTDFGTGDGPGIYSLAYSGGAPVCFATGTRIDTPSGPRRVEDLRIGDLLITRGGLQRIRWVGGSTFWVTNRFRPVRFAAGTLGARQDVRLSPQHRVCLRRGQDTVFVAAKHLVGCPGVDWDWDAVTVRYIHILCDRHEIVCADGLWCETMRPGALPPWAPLQNMQGAALAMATAGLPKKTAAECLTAKDARQLLTIGDVRRQNGFDLPGSIRMKV